MIKPKPVLVLNSGGFDSTVLLNCVANTFTKGEVYSLFFDYGQRSLLREFHCAENNAERVKAKHISIKLPKFEWTSSKFYVPGEIEPDTQYLEMRNLVFLSYAASLAQSVGADTIYMALLYSYWEYPDCSKMFVARMNKLLDVIGIRVKAPFINYDKGELAKYALRYGVTPEMFNSCDNPDSEGNPCWKCADCLDIKKIYGLK